MKPLLATDRIGLLFSLKVSFAISHRWAFRWIIDITIDLFTWEDWYLLWITALTLFTILTSFVNAHVRTSVSHSQVAGYRNWPRYGLRWSGWYCCWYELCRPSCGRASRHNQCCSGLQYQPRQRRPYKWSISTLPWSQFTKSKGNLRFRRLVPLFVPIGVCVTTHDDGTASDVTIGMWRHNQQVTNHERNGKPWFSLPK